MLLETGLWWHTPLILALGRQRQVDLCEFKVSLIYKVSSRTARAVTQRSPVFKKKGGGAVEALVWYCFSDRILMCSQTVTLPCKLPKCCVTGMCQHTALDVVLLRCGSVLTFFFCT